MALGSLAANLAARGFGSLMANSKKRKLEERFNSGVINAEDVDWLANYFLSKKDFSKAEFYAKKLLEINPNNSGPRDILMNVYFARKDYKSTINELELLIQGGKDLDSYYFSIGYCYFLLGNTELANEFRSKSIAINPKMLDYSYKPLK